MIPLDSDHCLTLVKVSELHRQMPDVLDADQVELLWTLSQRALAEDTHAHATDEEWVTIGNMLLTLEGARRQPRRLVA